MKRRCELTTTTIISKIRGGQNIYNPYYNIYKTSRPQIYNISIYMSVYENPIFLLWLLGFAGVVLRYNDRPPDKRRGEKVANTTFRTVYK